MFTLLLGQRIHQLQTYFKTERLARVLTMIAFLAIVVALVAGIYVFVEHAFAYVASRPDLAAALLLFSYEFTFLVIGLLVFVSALVGSISRLFDQPYDLWIIASPRFARAPLLNASETFVSSLWPICIIGLPTLAAALVVFHTSLLAALLELLALVAFGIMAAGAGLSYTLLALSLSRAISGRARRTHVIIAIVLACACVALVLLLQLRDVGAVVDTVFVQSAISSSLETQSITAHFAAFPSHPLAELFLSAQTGAFAGVAWNFSCCIAYALLSILAFLIFSRVHLVLWQDLQERGASGATDDTHARTRRVTFRADPVAVLAQKEFLVLTRNSRDLLWLGFVMLLWILQIGFDFVLRYDAFLQTTQITTISATVQSFQLVIIVYFVSMFVLRFVFPSFSAEKDVAWIVGSLPVSYGTLFRARLFFFSGMLVLLALVVALLHVLILGIAPMTALVLVLLVVASSALLVLFGLTLGVRYPNFDTADPELLSTSLPGIVFILGAVVYGILGALSMRSFLLYGSSTGVLCFLVGSGIAYWLLQMIARRALARFEFAA